MNTIKRDGFMGEGTLYLRRLDRPNLGFVEVGNATEVSVAVEVEIKERHSRMRENYGAVLNTVILPKSGELKIILDGFDEEGLAMVFMGALKKEAMQAHTVADETLTAECGRWLNLAHAYLNRDHITVKKPNQDALSPEHYSIHERLGMICLKETSGIAKGENIQVSYQTHDWNAWVIHAQSDNQIPCELLLDGRNLANGQDIKLHIPRAVLSPSGSFNFLSHDFNTIELTGRPEVVAGQNAPFTVTAKA